MRHGDVYRHELAGAGGWGDPLARDPERVRHDVLEEKITAAYARREYGVAIDEQTGAVAAGRDRAAPRGEESLRCGTPSGATGRWRR